MARIRTIKPDFWTDEKIVELDPVDRLLFIGLWNFADDQGYLDYSPKRIKMQVFPGDDIDVSRALARLHEDSLIALYDSPQGLVLHIPNWKKHQRISNPSRARFEPGDLHECDWPTDTLARAREDSVRKGREGKGRDKNSSPSADADEGDRFPEFWARYPRKVAKQDAVKAWRKVTKTTDPQVILDGLARHQFSDEAKFIPYPASWLNAGQWADEPAGGTLSILPGMGGFTAAELDRILGPAPGMPQPPSDLSPDEMWEWDQRTRREMRAARVQQANAKLGRSA